MVEAGCAVVDKQIREINWPENTLVVSVRRHGHEVIPTGPLELEEGDRVLVLMDDANGDEAEASVRRLCHGSFVPAQE